MSRHSEEIQFELVFPEYKFKVGDYVRILDDNRFTTEPFVITKRTFYDERPYDKRVDKFGLRNYKYTNWYYGCMMVNKLAGERYHRTTQVAEHNLELWKWQPSDSHWEA